MRPCAQTLTGDRMRNFLRCACVGFALTLAATAQATPAAPPAPATTASASTEPAHATARFFNRDPAAFRSTFLGNTPAMRARGMEANIERIVELPGEAKPSYQMAPQGVILMLDNQLVTVLTPADADALENETV